MDVARTLPENYSFIRDFSARLGGHDPSEVVVLSRGPGTGFNQPADLQVFAVGFQLKSGVTRFGGRLMARLPKDL